MTCSWKDVSLGLAPDALFQLYSYITGGERPAGESAVLGPRTPTATPRRSMCSPRSRKFAGAHPDPEAFVEAPRADAAAGVFDFVVRSKATPRVSLTVDAVRYQIGKRIAAWRRVHVPCRLGSRRTHSQSLCAPGAAIFGLPEDPAAPIINDRARHRRRAVPGVSCTKRMATKAPGRNWLFFVPPAPRLRLSFTRTSSPGMRAAKVPHPAVAGLVARRPPRSLRPRTACAKSAAICGRGLADGALYLRMRRRQTQWPRTSSARWVDIVGAVRRTQHRRGDCLCGRHEEARALSAGRLLASFRGARSANPESITTAVRTARFEHFPGRQGLWIPDSRCAASGMDGPPHAARSCPARAAA